MSKAKRIQLSFIGFALLYAFVGNYTWITAQTELFPIYSWDLFSYIPAHTSEFAIRITVINGETLDPPLYFNEATRYVPAAKTIEAFALIQRFGNAIYTNNGDAALLQQQFESLYLQHLATVNYDLVIRTFDAIDYAQSGSIDEVILLQTYQH